MSRGFVKEDDLEHAGTDLPERPLSSHPNYVTPVGHAQLQQEAAQLEAERQGLLANKDDPSTQQKLARINRDLRYMAARLESAIVIGAEKPALNSQEVHFGAEVEVEDMDGKTHVFSIVGEDEADIQAGKISWVSPLAKALIGHKVGDEVTWLRPAGNTTLIINAIFKE